jgi:predicted transcriptional regulator
MALITLDLSDEAVARLRDAAGRARVSESEIVERALGLDVVETAALRAAIAEAEADVAAGRVHDFDEVMAEMETIIAEAERRRV